MVLACLEKITSFRWPCCRSDWLPIITVIGTCRLLGWRKSSASLDLMEPGDERAIRWMRQLKSGKCPSMKSQLVARIRDAVTSLLVEKRNPDRKIAVDCHPLLFISEMLHQILPLDVGVATFPQNMNSGDSVKMRKLCRKKNCNISPALFIVCQYHLTDWLPRLPPQ